MAPAEGRKGHMHRTHRSTTCVDLLSKCIVTQSVPAVFPSNSVEEYLSSELPVFLELRVRYLQACEKLQEALALAKGCLENHSTGKHLYFHQAYLTCLYKASLHEHLHKEVRTTLRGTVKVPVRSLIRAHALFSDGRDRRPGCCGDHL